MERFNFKKLKERMKRKTTVLLLSLFFVSSVIAISSVNNGSQMAIIADYDSQQLARNDDQSANAFTLDRNVQLDSDDQLDSNEASEELVAQVESTEQDVIDYQTDSGIILVETKADKARLTKQKKEAERERQAKLTQQLNEQAKLALQQRLQENGEPTKSLGTEQVVVKAAEPNITDEISNQGSTQPQVAALTTEQQVTLKRQALNLGPPIPPGTLGGGNGNGGPGAGTNSVASDN